MNCRSARKYLPEYNGKGARPRDRRLERHLEECADCRSVLETYRAGLAAFKAESLPSDMDFTEAEWARAIRRATTEPAEAKAPFRLRSLRPALTYALLAVLVVAVAQFGHRRLPWLVPTIENQPVKIASPATVLEAAGPAAADRPSGLSDTEARFDQAALRPPQPSHRAATPPPTGDVPSLTWVSQKTGLKIAWFINENLKLED
jgi:anti-sigma factor RsiW